MKRLWRLGVVAAAGAAALLLSGCGSPPADFTEIVTFTDEHGRACTAAVVVDRERNEGNDYEVTSLDCDVLPEGQEPGPERYRPLPQRDAQE